MDKSSEDNVSHKEKRKTNELTIIKTDIEIISRAFCCP